MDAIPALYKLTPRQFYAIAREAWRAQAGDDAVALGHSRSVVWDKIEDEPEKEGVLTDKMQNKIRERFASSLTGSC